MTLKIHRVTKNKYEIRNGKRVVRECSSFKEASNALTSEDLILPDNMEEFCNTELDDLFFMESYREAM